jgi:transmembrane sensor
VPEDYANWRTGWLEADGMPLGFVIARLNRYTDDKIVLADDKLASVALSGRFRLDNTAGTLKQIAAVLDVTVTERDHHIVLTPKP